VYYWFSKSRVLLPHIIILSFTALLGFHHSRLIYVMAHSYFVAILSFTLPSFCNTLLPTALMSVVDAQQRAKSHLEKLEGCQEELRKRDAEVRKYI